MAIKFYFLIMHIAITHYLTAKVLQTALVRVPRLSFLVGGGCGRPRHLGGLLLLLLGRNALLAQLVLRPPTLLILNSRCRPLMELIRLLILTGFVHYQD